MNMRGEKYQALRLVGAAVVLAGCGGDDDWSSFENALDSGAPCAELFEIRNHWHEGSPLVDSANEALRAVGCYNSSSERTDQ